MEQSKSGPPLHRHPLVAKTAQYFSWANAELQRRAERSRDPLHPNWSVRESKPFVLGRLINGRLNSAGEGRLHILATLKNIDWILSFHDALIELISGQGLKVVTRGSDRESFTVEIVGAGGVLSLSFAEDFDKIGGAYVAKDTYRVKLQGRQGAVPKMWQGTALHLDGLLNEIAAKLPSLLRHDAEHCRRLDAEHAQWAADWREQQAAAAKVARQNEIQAARTAQAERFLSIAKQHADFLFAKELLNRRIREVAAGDPVRLWLSVVSEALTDPLADLEDEIRAQAAAADERPLWWPPS